MDALELAKGTLRSFDSGSYTATVQLDGSLFVYLRSVPVSRGIPAAAMTTGATLALALFDPTNPNDALVIGVF